MGAGRPRQAAANLSGQLSVEHYLNLIFHRKYLILGVFLLVTAATCIVSYQLPDIYSSETLIMVDPQKVPENYVKSTVTGDIRNRLSTLSQQILSATRLQKIIDNLNLYPEERKKKAREEVIALMRSHIAVRVVSDFGGSQDLQAFRISYSGKEPRLVAQVTNELASLFIEENLKAREQQATGTTEFIQNQLKETRKALEEQEAKLRDFKLKHIGEMPEQQQATLQVLGQLQSQLQLEGDALGRAEQQKSYLQSLMAQSAPVVDLDERESRSRIQTVNAPAAAAPAAPRQTTLTNLKARLAALLTRYTEQHPEVLKVKGQIEEEEARLAVAAAEPAPVQVAEVRPAPAPAAPPKAERRDPVVPKSFVNPVLLSQLEAVENEINKHKAEQARLAKLVASYRAKLEAVPVREQQIADLVRDYEISKAHYSQLLEKQLSAEAATQLEIRQKGERFTILDPAQPAGKPSGPKRLLINAAGAVAGLALGLLLALITEFLGISITSPDQILASGGVAVLAVIPIIQTGTDRILRKKRLIMTTASMVLMVVVVSCAYLVYRFHA
jgi:polysaccharide chain length determinant protein (PEP-CTERM system associated)